MNEFPPPLSLEHHERDCEYCHFQKAAGSRGLRHRMKRAKRNGPAEIEKKKKVSPKLKGKCHSASVLKTVPSKWVLMLDFFFFLKEPHL